VIEVAPLAEGDELIVAALARAMHSESPIYSQWAFEREVLMDWIKLCRDNEDWLCLIAWDNGVPIGFLAVGAVPMLFNRARTVDDLALFVVPERRGSTAALRLLRIMEPWARQRAVAIRMGVTTGTNQRQAIKFLERLGYVQTGVLLTKQIV
jgi:GNAT superfamily N-acetyltransferase